MLITESKLKQIIREELEKETLDENKLKTAAAVIGTFLAGLGAARNQKTQQVQQTNAEVERVIETDKVAQNIYKTVQADPNKAMKALNNVASSGYASGMGLTQPDIRKADPDTIAKICVYLYQKNIVSVIPQTGEIYFTFGAGSSAVGSGETIGNVGGAGTNYPSQLKIGK